MKQTSLRYLLAASGFTVALSPSAARAAAWTGNGAGASWATNANWADNAAPSGTISFGSGAVAKATQTLDGSYAITRIRNFSGTAVTINNGTGTNTLTFNSAISVFDASTSDITVGSGLTVGFASGLTSTAVTASAGRTVDIASAINLTNAGSAAVNLGVTGSGTVTLSGPISGAGRLSITSPGVTNISGTNSYLGANQTVIGSGVVNFYGDQRLATGGWTLAGDSANFMPDSLIAFSGTTGLTLTAAAAGTRSLNVAGSVTGGSIDLNSIADGAKSTMIIESGASWLQARIAYLQTSTVGGSVEMTVKGTCMLNPGGTIFVGSSTSRGTATLNIDGGLVQAVSLTNASANSTASANVNFSNGGKFKLVANVTSMVATLGTAVNVTVGAGGGIIDTNGFTTTLAPAVTGAGRLTKAGAGTLTLSGSNTYTGGTAVGEGRLRVTGAIVIGGASGITVASGAVLALDGTLRLTDTQATIANGGTVALGAGTSVLDLNGLFTSLTYGQTYDLFDNVGTITGGFKSITGYDNVNFKASFDNTTGKVTFNAVPEPSTYGLLGAGALAGAAVFRRRRARGKTV